MADPGAAASTQVHRNVVIKRYILPDELLALQGWPIHTSPVPLADHSGTTEASLAGSAFSGQVCLAVFASAFAAIPWKRYDVVEAQSADVDEAGSALELALSM